MIVTWIKPHGSGVYAPSAQTADVIADGPTSTWSNKLVPTTYSQSSQRNYWAEPFVAHGGMPMHHGFNFQGTAVTSINNPRPQAIQSLAVDPSFLGHFPGAVSAYYESTFTPSSDNPNPPLASGSTENHDSDITPATQAVAAATHSPFMSLKPTFNRLRGTVKLAAVLAVVNKNATRRNNITLKWKSHLKGLNDDQRLYLEVLVDTGSLFLIKQGFSEGIPGMDDLFDAADNLWKEEFPSRERPARSTCTFRFIKLLQANPTFILQILNLVLRKGRSRFHRDVMMRNQRSTFTCASLRVSRRDTPLIV